MIVAGKLIGLLWRESFTAPNVTDKKKPRHWAAVLLAGKNSLERTDLRRLHALGALLRDELDLLAFLEGAEARALDFLEVGEEVGTAVSGGDEAEALGVVEPLHGTSRYV